MAVSTDPLIKQAQRLMSATLDLLFPPRCAVCGRPGVALCQTCVEEFERVTGPVCPVCGEPQTHDQRCQRCAVGQRAFQSVRSAFWFRGGVRRAIHALKYQGRRGVAATLAEAMAQQLPPPGGLEASLCAVPLHPRRRAERGYNQADLLAAGLSRFWSLPVLPSEALIRNRETASQVGLDYAARQVNVGGAFVARREYIAGTAVVLVDDVCTTGATLDACAQALIAGGAACVSAVTLARAVGASSDQ